MPDPVSTFPDRVSLHGRIHDLFGALVFLLIPISCFVFLLRFREDPQWRWFQWWTLAAGTVTAVLIIIWSVGPTQPPAPPNLFNALNGLIQRAILVIYLSWIFTFALGLRRQAK